VSDQQQHQDAVNLARLEVQSTMRYLGVAREQAENAVAAVNNAVGQLVSVESARNAFEYIGAVSEAIPELIAKCEVSIQELTRYQGGF
jgi:hypothetical protein